MLFLSSRNKQYLKDSPSSTPTSRLSCLSVGDSLARSDITLVRLTIFRGPSFSANPPTPSSSRPVLPSFGKDDDGADGDVGEESESDDDDDLRLDRLRLALGNCVGA